MNWQVARSKIWALLSLGLKLKSKPSRVLVGSKAARRRRSLLWARLDFILQEHGEEFHEGGLLLDGLAIAHVEGLEDAGHAQGTQHGGELMSQFHGDRSSSAPGSGKKVVQGRACRGGAVATAAARGVKPGRG